MYKPRFRTILTMLVMLLCPLLVMRLICEDRQKRTDQLLLTSPVSLPGIVLGKYFSAFCVYLVAISASLLMAVVLSFYGEPDWPVIIGNIIGLVLLGASLIAVCMFLSSITESQVIAAVSGFAVSLLLVLMDAMINVVSGRVVQKIFSYMSFNGRYNGFTIGIIDFSNVLFFVSIGALFILLTAAVLEKRRWS